MESCQGTTADCRRLRAAGEFLQVVGLGAVASLAGSDPARAMAGPFDASDFARLVPPDKKLDPAWVKSLFDRGEQHGLSRRRAWR